MMLIFKSLSAKLPDDEYRLLKPAVRITGPGWESFTITFNYNEKPATGRLLDKTLWADILKFMSERSERPASPDRSNKEDGLYDAAAMELVSICRDKFAELESNEETNEIDERSVYLEAPSTYDEWAGEWERIDLYKYGDSWVDDDGSDRVLRLEFNQFLTDEVEFIKRYTLRFSNDRYSLVKQYFLYLGYEKSDNLAWSPVTEEVLASKDELNQLSSLVILANVE
jgi:hypothetical protein